ncbi:MAG: Rieske 2Fe-2S domain-containing protein, partial [Nitrososphaerota archaeon]|nr:Rieske 2Fe-2S domain-containing protein [Nitrososphaerota archaeon]
MNVWQDLCIHRGTKLSLGHLNGGLLECAYHGWTFSNTGDLSAITYPDGYREDFSKEAYDLGRAPRVQSYRG